MGFILGSDAVALTHGRPVSNCSSSIQNTPVQEKGLPRATEKKK